MNRLAKRCLEPEAEAEIWSCTWTDKLDICGPKKCEIEALAPPPSPPSMFSPPQDGLCIPGDDDSDLIVDSNTVTATVTSSGVISDCEIAGEARQGCQRFCYLIEQSENGNGPNPLFSVGFDVSHAPRGLFAREHACMILRAQLAMTLFAAAAMLLAVDRTPTVSKRTILQTWCPERSMAFFSRQAFSASKLDF